MDTFSLAALDSFVLCCLLPEDDVFDDEGFKVDGPATGSGASMNVPW